MRILGIETSCDETAAAVVEDGVKILSHTVASSANLQQKYGGIVPEVAARRQVEAIIPVIQETVRARRDAPTINALAVTIGPGLIGSLLVGVETAKTLSYVWQKPLIPVNHLVGHIYSAWLSDEMPKFPALALIVSGGHTELILMQDHGNFQKIGQTLDDAAGEAFDKVAQLLDLGYPGGPKIERLAKKGNPQIINFPRPMLGSDNLNFSFSGLKTAVRQYLTSNARYPYHKADLAASFQQAVIDVLVGKTLRAAEEYRVKSILLTGGVAANLALREALNQEIKRLAGVKFFCPPISLATDNATYIAAAAYFNYNQWIIAPNNQELFNLSPNPSLKIT